MSESTFYSTRQDLRKAESRLANLHGGNPPSNSTVSQMKVSHFQVKAPIRALELIFRL